MHSPSEDLVAFMHACSAVPQPLFDTQAAAALAGIAAGIGYQRLVQNVLGVALAKGETRSDWLRRRSEEHTSELQSLMRKLYAGFCLIKKILYVDQYGHTVKIIRRH